MNNFFCQLGLLHDADHKVSGNNIWYSALFESITGKKRFDRDIISDQFVFIRFIPKYNIRTLRYPDNFNLDSHDNMLGFLYFNALDADDLKRANWYINGYVDDTHTWKQCFNDIYRLIKDHGFNPHRNTWWQGDYRAIGKIANKLPMCIRWYASREIKYYPAFLFHIFVSWIKPNFKKDVRQTNNVSAKIQCWFMLKTTKSRFLIRLFDIKKLSSIYFPENHPINKILNKK